MNIVLAFHGRLLPEPCYKKETTNFNCENTEALSIVNQRCQEKSECTLCTYFYPDPCPGTYKYVKVRFECKIENSTFIDLKLKSKF